MSLRLLSVVLMTVASARAQGGCSVFVPCPGLSLGEVESSVVAPLEAVLAAELGRHGIRSMCLPEACLVEIEALPKRSVEDFCSQVRTLCASVRLPKECWTPILLESRRDPRPFALWMLTGSMSKDVMGALALELRHVIEQVPGVGRVDTLGAGTPRTLIGVDAASLVRAGLSHDAILDALRSEARATSKSEELGSIVVGANDGAPIRLKEVAQVEVGFLESRRVRFQDRPVVLLKILPGAQFDGRNTEPALHRVIARWQQSLPKTQTEGLDVIRMSEAPHVGVDILGEASRSARETMAARLRTTAESAASGTKTLTVDGLPPRGWPEGVGPEGQRLHIDFWISPNHRVTRDRILGALRECAREQATSHVVIEESMTPRSVRREIVLKGPDWGSLETGAQKIVKILRTSPQVEATDASSIIQYPRMVLEFDAPALTRHALPVTYGTSLVQLLGRGFTLEGETPVTVRLHPSLDEDPTKALETKLKTTWGVLDLSTVARVRLRADPWFRVREGLHRAVVIRISLSEGEGVALFLDRVRQRAEDQLPAGLLLSIRDAQ